jgi:hypothetical protein
MNTCATDNFTDLTDPPTQEAIELARQQQLQLIKDLRRKLEMVNWPAVNGVVRPFSVAGPSQV